jgi:hypothetical protein
MKAYVLRGSKEEIAEGVARIDGDVREAIVFVEEPSPALPTGGSDELFAEMERFMVDVPDVDDSRDAIYRRMDGE